MLLLHGARAKIDSWTQIPAHPVCVHRDDTVPIRLRLNDQIKHVLFAQILTELFHMQLKFEEMQATLFAHVNPARQILFVGA